MLGMRIFHIATLADWKQAQQSGTYTTSTRGRTLAQEGFIHAARREQVHTVLHRFYDDVAEPLVVLEIETDLLDVPWREEQVGDETYPHVYGALPVGAVVGWRPARPPVFDRVAERPSTPAVTSAFQGLAVVLGVASVAFFVAAVISQDQVDQARLPRSVPFLLWTFMLISGLCAAVSYAVAERARAVLGSRRDDS
jgi:uncharacterized protein (DUF952 family)